MVLYLNITENDKILGYTDRRQSEDQVEYETEVGIRFLHDFEYYYDMMTKSIISKLREYNGN